MGHGVIIAHSSTALATGQLFVRDSPLTPGMSSIHRRPDKQTTNSHISFESLVVFSWKFNANRQVKSMSTVHATFSLRPTCMTRDGSSRVLIKGLISDSWLIHMKAWSVNRSFFRQTKALSVSKA